MYHTFINNFLLIYSLYVIIITFLYLLLHFIHKAKYIKPGVYSDFVFVRVFPDVFAAS